MANEMMHGKVRVTVLAETENLVRVSPVNADDYELRAYWTSRINLAPVKVSKTKKGGNSGTTQHQA